MRGDDLVRHCAKCDQNVYNLSGMTRREAQAVVRRHEGRLCARFFRRPDGRIQTRRCPPAVRRALGWAVRQAAAFGIAIPALAHEDGSCGRSTAKIEYTAEPGGGGGIRVVVRDASGARIPETEIRLYRPDQPLSSRSLVTDRFGRAEANDVAGEWKLTILSPGFVEYRRDAVLVRAEEVMNVDATLEVGGVGGVDLSDPYLSNNPFRAVARWFRRLGS